MATDAQTRANHLAELRNVAVGRRDDVIRYAYRDGFTRREIADACGLSYSQVCRIVQETKP